MGFVDDVIVVSAYGRGNWMAADLARQGMKVTMVDVSEILGRWGPEDWEGPFGYFQVESLRESQLTRLNEEDYVEYVPDGFVLWLEDGVIDTSGPLSQHQFSQRGIDEFQINYVKHPKTSDLSSFQGLGYQKKWYLHLLHSVASTGFYPNSQAMEHGLPLPVFSSHAIRRVSRRGYQQNLDWVESWGAKVLKAKALRDISTNSGFVQGLEVESDWKGVLSGEQYLWCLSGVETLHISSDLAQALYSKILWPQWQWQRFRYEIQSEYFWANLPIHMVLVGDVDLPWAHENLMILQKSVAPGVYDLWMRLPHTHRFHKNYLQEKSNLATQVLKGRLPGAEIELQQLPQESLYAESELGPARFPVYAGAALDKYKNASWINLHYDSPETWEMLEWSSIFKHQSTLVDEIFHWKKERDEKKAKEALRAEANL